MGLGHENFEENLIRLILIKKADEECYEKLEIDKEKIWASNKVNCIEKQTNVIYSDHHLM